MDKQEIKNRLNGYCKSKNCNSWDLTPEELCEFAQQEVERAVKEERERIMESDIDENLLDMLWKVKEGELHPNSVLKHLIKTLKQD